MFKNTLIASLLCLTLHGHAQDTSSFDNTTAKTVTEVATQIAVGHANVLDTYLSPEKYRGMELRFISNVVKDKPNNTTRVLNHEGALANPHNRAENAHALTGSYDFSYAMLYRWNLMDNRMTIRAGGMGDLNIGFCYNTRNNANNPAQGYLALDIGAMVMANYRFTLWNKPCRVNYEARLPLLGLMFSPNYGQSYYEIFSENNYDHNVVFRSLNAPQLRQQLSIDYPINKKGMCLRVGYICDIRQSKPNNLRQHHWYNAATIGLVIKK